MPSELPERPSLEYLKKLAKERLRSLRLQRPAARLAEAQLALAREYGFSSWRTLKAEVERRTQSPVEGLFDACARGDLPAVTDFLSGDPSLARARHGGTTPLHLAVKHPAVIRLLLEHGADPDAREEGDHATPLHGAAGHGSIESVRALLDAGADPQGEGDLHHMDVIGWATVFADARRDVVELLLSRGARHHIFSAIAMGDPELVRQVVRDNPATLRRRLSRFEQDQTALHYVVAPADGLVGGTFRTGDHYRTLQVLIELGADLEARDAKGRTPLALAMLKGDREAMRLLHQAGASVPELPAAAEEPSSALAPSIGKVQPMFSVTDMDATIAWYREVGFELAASHRDDDRIDWAMLKFGEAEIMLVPGPSRVRSERRGLSLWITTDRLDDLYSRLKRRQMALAREALKEPGKASLELRFTADLYTAFYGQREFGLLDPNGIEIMFAQPVQREA